MNSKKAKGLKSKAVYHPVLRIAGNSYNKLFYQENQKYAAIICYLLFITEWQVSPLQWKPCTSKLLM